MSALAIRDEQHYLATVAEVRTLVDRIENVGDAKEVADKARAAQVWAERARLGDEQVNLAAIARLWAERRAGELLAETVRPRGRNSSADGALPEGIAPHESSRWQKLAEIPGDAFEDALDEAAANGKVTATAVRRIAVPLSDELIAEQQRQANVQHLSRCVRGLEVTPEHARAEMKRLVSGDHPFTVERFECAAKAALAYADQLRQEATNGSA